MLLNFKKSGAVVVFTVAFAILLAGCGLLGSGKSELEGTKWQLQALEGVSPAAQVIITADFNDGRVSGSSGCNSYGAAYTTKDGKLTLDSVAVTEMACEDVEAMRAEQDFLQFLGQVRKFKLDGDRLDLMDDGGTVVLAFAKQP
jgi:heat shock protein HslJ